MALVMDYFNQIIAIIQSCRPSLKRGALYTVLLQAFSWHSAANDASIYCLLPLHPGWLQELVTAGGQ